MIRLYIIAVDTPRPLPFPFRANVDLPAAIEVVPIATARKWSPADLERVLDDLETIVAPARKQKELFNERP